MTNLKISASILSANFACLGADVNAVLNAGADLIHVDVMDNHYVPNLTFGPLVCHALRHYGISAALDVHLMVKPVDELIIAFAEAGATTITIHPEATEHVDRSLQLIKAKGCRAGLAINPGTPLCYLSSELHRLDNILMMSVNPGFGGQTFIPEVLDKIKKTRKMIIESKRTIQLSVDGGVKVDNIRQIADAGADTFIIGSALFGTQDYTATIKKFREQLK